MFQCRAEVYLHQKQKTQIKTHTDLLQLIFSSAKNKVKQGEVILKEKSLKQPQQPETGVHEYEFCRSVTLINPHTHTDINLHTPFAHLKYIYMA